MSSAPFELNNSLVRAGAGAGKTRGLVERVVEIYRKYAHRESGPPRIILTTFTRKATQELKERLILRACSEKDADLLQFVSDPAKLQISTIHGLLNLFLQQVGHLAGLDSGFQIITEPEGLALARLAFREVIAGNPLASKWLETYGFDRTLEMCRIYQSHVAEQGELKPAQLSDLEVLFEKEVGLWRETLNTLASEILETNDGKSWVKYAETLKDFVSTWSGKPQDIELPRKPNRRGDEEAELHAQVEDVIREFKKRMDQLCWNSDLWPQMIAEWVEFQPLGDQFTKQLMEIKNTQGRFQMSDLEWKSYEILRSNPFLSSVFSENWDYWMIDEYQDTSPLQVAILKELIGDKPKYLVGDPQQSIYLFRGAEVGVFKTAENEIRAGGGDVRELMKNYRSQPEVLNFMNDFMTALSSSFARMEPREEAHPKMTSVTFWRAPDESTELQGLVAHVQRLLKEGARLEDICVLGRTHRNLMQVSRVFKDFGLPTHVHASRGYANRREVLDASALWKFLINPHDNINLVMLLRSPWFLVADGKITEWMESRPQSLWRKLQHLNESELPESIARLKKAWTSGGEKGIVRAFESALTENALIDLSLVNDPAGRKESNLWKLIHRAQALEKEGGQSILNLMQGEADNPLESNEGDATSAQEPNSINLMTIHGAKGLEFDHVLLPAMGEDPLFSNVLRLHAQGGVFHFPIWTDTEEGFVASPLDYLAMREKRRREFEEIDRWLYVGLTRAKKSLTLSWSKMEKDSWAARNPWFTKPKGLHETTNYIFEVVEEMPPAEVYSSSLKSADQVRAPFTDLGAHEAEVRHSVTDLVDARVNVKLNSDGILKRWQAQTTGTSLHRTFESLKYRDFDVSEGDEDVEFVLSLQEPPMRELIQEGEVEWGFQVQAEGNVIEGQIDLWAKHSGKLYVIDYKSGSTAFKESAFTQLGLYAWALRKFGHKEPAELVVIYPRQKKIETREFTEELFLYWEKELGGS